MSPQRLNNHPTAGDDRGDGATSEPWVARCTVCHRLSTRVYRCSECNAEITDGGDTIGIQDLTISTAGDDS